jgi:hypothetical protein
MCYKQDYRKVTNAEALELSLPIKPCSTLKREAVALSPTASITTQTPRPNQPEPFPAKHGQTLAGQS